MNDQPDMNLWKESLQKDLLDYLKNLWHFLWMFVWGVLCYQYYVNVNPYNQADQLILAVVCLLAIMNFLREYKIPINNILFLSATWLMLIFGAFLPIQHPADEWIQLVLGYSALLFLIRIFATRKDFMDEIFNDAEDDQSGEDKNKNDKTDESKQ